MKKFTILCLFMVCGFTFMQAGPWIVGLNHVEDFLVKVEQGNFDGAPEVPVLSRNENSGNLDTDCEAANDAAYNIEFVGIEVGMWTTTAEGINFESIEFNDPFDNHKGLKSIEIINRGFVQKEGTMISFHQLARPDEITNWPLGNEPSEKREHFNQYLADWLEKIDLSGNDLREIEIDGRETMPLKVLNLSNNPNLTYLDIYQCSQLELVDIRNTSLSDDIIQKIIDDVLEFSPNAQILYGNDDSSIKTSNASNIVVYMNNSNITVSNKASNDKVYVYNLLGKLMLESLDSTIDVSKLNSGIYMVKVNDQVSKVVKK